MVTGAEAIQDCTWEGIPAGAEAGIAKTLTRPIIRTSLSLEAWKSFGD